MARSSEEKSDAFIVSDMFFSLLNFLLFSLLFLLRPFLLDRVRSFVLRTARDDRKGDGEGEIIGGANQGQ